MAKKLMMKKVKHLVFPLMEIFLQLVQVILIAEDSILAKLEYLNIPMTHGYKLEI